MPEPDPEAATPPARLVDRIAAGECVLFLGAGVSLDAGAPTGAQLSDEIGSEFLDMTPPTGYPLSEMAALVDAEDGRSRLNDWIAKRLRDLEPSAALRVIPRFRWQAIYTANFDLLVEKAYAMDEGSLQRLHPIYSNRDSVSRLEADEVPLYKLHGCISRPNSDEGRLVLTQDDFATVEASRRRLFNRLVDHVADLPVLYVGFARADPDFARVLATVEQAVDGLASLSRSYALQPGFIEAESKRAELKKVSLLNVGAHEFFAALALQVTPSMRTESATADSPGPRSRLLTRRPGSSDALRSMLADYEVVEDVLADGESDPETFFKGSVSSWGDIRESVDAQRDEQDALVEALIVDTDLDKGRVDFVLLHAEAGAGKSTLLRRVGAELVDTWDCVVLSLKPFGALEFLDVERLSSKLDERVYLLVDDAARVATELRSFVDSARRAGAKITIVAAARTNEWQDSREAQLLTPRVEFELAALSRDEIDRVLATLDQHGQLGSLEGANEDAQRHAFEARAQNQLLVALREATEGKAFDEIVVDEFEGMVSEDAKRGYLYVAALHRFGLLTRAAVLHRALRIPLTELGARVFGPATKIVLSQDLATDPEPYYRTRHPLIAGIVFDRLVPTESDRLAFYVSLIRELDLGYASDADTYRRLSRSLNRYLLADFQKKANKRALMHEIQELDPSDAYVHQHAAMMELSFGDLRVAAAHIAKAIEARPNDAAIRDTEGRIVLAGVDRESSRPRKLAKLAEAEAIFSKNISRRPNEPYGYRHLAETYWMRAMIEEDAVTKATYLTLAYQTLQDGSDAAINISMLTQYRAELENKAGNRTEARLLLKGALNERPDDVRMRLIAARFAELDGDTGDALELLRQGVAVAPDAWELHYRLALMLASGAGEAGEVSRHFASATLAPTRRYMPRLAYAAWLFSQAEYEKSAEQFARLEQLELPTRERREARTFRFAKLAGKHLGRVNRLSYDTGHVEYDGGATRIFFHKSDVADDYATLRVGSTVSYDLAFNLRGPLARRLRSQGGGRSG